MKRGMRIVSRYDPNKRQPNHNSRLWKTCYHEAAHYIVALNLDFHPSWPRIMDVDAGVTHDERMRVPFPAMRSVAEREIWRRDGIISAAGPAASAELEWYTPGCEYDRAHIKICVRVLEGAYTAGDLMVAAEWMIDESRSRIIDTADALAVEFARDHL